jgi:nucleoside-diphosphate-sugar epimerase
MMDFSGKIRVLVTGASGFIGRHTLPELVSRGYDVHAIGRTSLPEIRNVTWHQCDLLVPGAVVPIVRALRADHLLHLAWNAVPGSFWSALENLDWVAATLQLFRAFAASGGRRAVFAGTCAEYDWSFDLLSEDETPMVPRTLYGRAKGAVRDLVLDPNASKDVSVAWAHLFLVYGPGEPRGKLVSDLVAGLLAGQAVDCTEGRQERDYIHVKDVARAFVDVLVSDFRGTVNIASGVCRPVASMIDEIARQVGRPDLVRLGALSLSPNESRRLAANTTRLFDRVGFKPRFDVAAGIADTIAASRAKIVGSSPGR